MSSIAHPEIVTVLGGGWSALFVDRDQLPGHVIGVNDSGVLAHCDTIVSMDRLWAEWRWQDMLKMKRSAYLRDAALKNMADRPAWLTGFKCDYKSVVFSEDEGVLNGTNSGACALNLAWRMAPATVYLIGFDMNRSPNGNAYWYKPYPWTTPEGATKAGKYNEWMGQFEQIAAQFKAKKIEVINVSTTSSIEVFTKITPAEFQKKVNP